MKTVTVGDLKRVLEGIPGDQPLLGIDEEGLARPVEDLEPLTVTDHQTGKPYFTRSNSSLGKTSSVAVPATRPRST